MSFASAIALLFKEPKGKIGTVRFDAVLVENHDLQNEVTDHPVEPGSGLAAAADVGKPASVSDNVRRKPDVITITGVVTNTPSSGPAAIIGVPLVRGIVGVGKSIASGGNVLDSILDAENSLASEAFNTLSDIRDNGSLVLVTTKFKDYKNMVITSLSVNQSSTTGSALWCTVTLKEVRLVKSVFVNIPVAPKVNRAKKPVSKGTQSGAAPDATKKEAGKESMLKTTIYGVGR